RTGIEGISQIALDLNFEGLMIETHVDPDNAWSDAAQQITPDRLVEIMNDLKVREPKAEGEALDQLTGLRAEIDVIDNHILDTLAERMKVVEQIGEVKKGENISILQDDRWATILETVKKEAAVRGLSDAFVESVFKAIHQESINHQEAIVSGK
ncbi:MAG: chorismate mutase, partial [Flavicella sp.]|nr:chorismate mutase [Flavicella sp.]